MSDYTPTTEEVRRAYRRGILPLVSLEPAFDHWLAEVKAKAFDEGTSAQALLDLPIGDTYMPARNPYRQGES